MAGAILVPLDFQDPSLEALRVACDLGKRLDREVVLLHVYTVPVIVYPGFDPIVMPGLPEEVANAAKGALDGVAAKAGGLRTMLRSGEPAREILRAIEETKPSMVVVGTHGRRGLSHLLLGSIAEKIVRTSPAPVLTVHAPQVATTG